MDSACANVDSVDTSRSRRRSRKIFAALDLRALLQTACSRLVGAAHEHQVEHLTSLVSATSMQSANTVAEVVQGRRRVSRIVGFSISVGNPNAWDKVGLRLDP